MSIGHAVLWISARSISHCVCSSTSGNWMRLVGGQRLAERLALLGVLDRLVDAELRRAEARRGLADAVLVEEVLHDLQAPALAAEDRVVSARARR